MNYFVKKQGGYRTRDDILFHEIFQPTEAPAEFYDLQQLCHIINHSEKRYDARTGREFIGSLPNELPLEEQIRIVREFIENNFIARGLCIVAAIHAGEKNNPPRNNPHVHLYVSTRQVMSDGFSKQKDRELDKRQKVMEWRKSWADVQNQAYARNGLPHQVSHESLEVQGIWDKKPTIHLSRYAYELEKKGVRTDVGDRKREIEERNRQREIEVGLRRERRPERSLSR